MNKIKNQLIHILPQLHKMNQCVRRMGQNRHKTSVPALIELACDVWQVCFSSCNLFSELLLGTVLFHGLAYMVFEPRVCPILYTDAKNHLYRCIADSVSTEEQCHIVQEPNTDKNYYGGAMVKWWYLMFTCIVHSFFLDHCICTVMVVGYSD